MTAPTLISTVRSRVIDTHGNFMSLYQRTNKQNRAHTRDRPSRKKESRLIEVFLYGDFENLPGRKGGRTRAIAKLSGMNDDRTDERQGSKEGVPPGGQLFYALKPKRCDA